MRNRLFLSKLTLRKIIMHQLFLGLLFTMTSLAHASIITTNYTYDNIGRVVSTTYTNAVGVSSINYSYDAAGNVISTTTTGTVVIPNQPPVPTAQAITTSVGLAGTSQVVVNDPNATDTHTYTVSTAPLNGTAIVGATGLATYTPNAGYAGSDSFVVTVTDNGAPQKSGTVTIGVTVTAAPVADTTAPVITLIGNANVSIVQGGSYVDAGATASDNIDGNITNQIIVQSTVNTSVVGTYTVTYTVSDAAGNAATPVVRTVTVTAAPVADTVAPVITLIGASPVTIVQGSVFIDPGVTALDNVDGIITGQVIVVNGVNTSGVGTYMITYDVTDAAGNVASQVVRIINVVPAGGAAGRGETVQVVVPGTNTVIEISSAGEIISNFSAVANSGTPPEGVTAPFGVLSYTTTVPIGATEQTIELSFGSTLPAVFELYKVDSLGQYTLIPQGTGVDQWYQVNASTISMTLSDGGQFDLDNSVNGIIVDPIAIVVSSTTAVTPTPSNTNSSGNAGGGGGCLVPQASSALGLLSTLGLMLFGLIVMRRKN